MTSYDNTEFDTGAIDYERARRRAVIERRQAIDNLMRTVFQWRARSGFPR